MIGGLLFLACDGETVLGERSPDAWVREQCERAWPVSPDGVEVVSNKLKAARDELRGKAARRGWSVDVRHHGRPRDLCPGCTARRKQLDRVELEQGGRDDGQP